MVECKALHEKHAGVAERLDLMEKARFAASLSSDKEHFSWTYNGRSFKQDE